MKKKITSFTQLLKTQKLRPFCRVRSYNLSVESIAALEDLTHRLMKESHMYLSMSKVIELLIFNAEKIPITELIVKQ